MGYVHVPGMYIDEGPDVRSSSYQCFVDQRSLTPSYTPNPSPSPSPKPGPAQPYQSSLYRLRSTNAMLSVNVPRH